MRILMTGGSGFIGKPIIEKLCKAGHSVLALSRNPIKTDNETESKCLQWIESSLNMDSEAIAHINAFAPETVIHLAWERIPDFSFNTSFENLRTQTFFFQQIFTIPSIKKIVVAGSCWEYNKKFGNCVENENCISGNYFTWAKNSLRDFLRFESLKNNVNLIWARIFYVYGPGQKSESLMPSVIREIKNGRNPNLNKPLNANDFIYVDDVAEGLIKLTLKDIASGIYNLGSGQSTQVIDIVKTVERTICKSEMITSELLNKTSNATREIDFWADIQKTQECLDWRPKVSLEEGIVKTINLL